MSAIDAGRVLAALGDPTRRAIVERLSLGPASISGLAAPLGVSLTAISQHLQVLESCGLASTAKAGRVRTCRLEPQGLQTLEGWARETRSAWEQRLVRLGDLLAEDDETKPEQGD